MTQATFWIGLGTALLSTVAWLLVVAFYFADEGQAGRRAIRRYRDYLDSRLRFLRMRHPASRILTIQLTGCVVALGVAFVNDSSIPLILVPLVALGPKVYLERLSAKRVTEVEAQIEPWLVAIANGLKASPSMGESIAASVSLLSAPMSEEVALMVKEYELGTALDRAVEQFAKRVGSRTLAGAVLALQVARNSGGNLPEMLENAALALRELARLEGVVRTKTAEGKAQAFVIGAIPVPMVVGIHLIDRHFFDPLVATFAGHLVIGAAVALWASAIVLASKILDVDVCRAAIMMEPIRWGFVCAFATTITILVGLLSKVKPAETPRYGYRGAERKRALDEGGLFALFEPVIRFVAA
ncbi:MAG: type II secretion system F family protein, partial [Myxococcales bacterium]